MKFRTMMLWALQQIYCIVIFIFLNIELPRVISVANAVAFHVNGSTREIFGSFTASNRTQSKMKIHPTCIRVPVREGHLESITAVMSEDVDVNQLRERFRNFGNGSLKARLPTLPEKSVILIKGEDRPQPLLDVMAGSPERARGMAVTVGRLRVSGSRVSFVALVNNLIRGAAGSAVLNAEVLHESGLIT